MTCEVPPLQVLPRQHLEVALIHRAERPRLHEDRMPVAGLSHTIPVGLTHFRSRPLRDPHAGICSLHDGVEEFQLSVEDINWEHSARFFM